MSTAWLSWLGTGTRLDGARLLGAAHIIGRPAGAWVSTLEGPDPSSTSPGCVPVPNLGVASRGDLGASSINHSPRPGGRNVRLAQVKCPILKQKHAILARVVGAHGVHHGWETHSSTPMV